MSASFPSEQPAKMDRLLAILETGEYPAAEGAPVMRQAPLYAVAQVPSPAEFILPGPGQQSMIPAAVNPERRESMRRLLPMWRW